MNKISVFGVLLIAIASYCSGAAEAQTEQAAGSDWPQWAGPDGNYTSPEKGLLREWPAEGPQVLWRAKIGTGWSCPSVSGDEVYVVSTEWSTKWEDGEKETTVCLDAKTGKELWKYVYDTGKHYQSGNVNVGWHGGGPRATPYVTDKYVYTFGLIGRASCLDRKTHDLVWGADLEKSFWPGPYPEWKGVNCSPVVADGIMPVQFAYDKFSRCAGLDAATGQVKWIYPTDTPQPAPKGHAPGTFTPLITMFGKDRCAIVANSKNRPDGHAGFPALVALRLTDGKPIWQFDWFDDKDADGVQQPYLLDHQLVFHTNGSTVTVDVDFKTEPFPTKVASVAKIGANYHGFTSSGGCFFGFLAFGDANELPKWTASIVCVDRKTGNTLWQEGGFKSGVSMIAADGLLFARSFQSLFLIEASPKGYVLKSKVEKLHGETNSWGKDGSWVMPVLSRGKLYIRTPNELICYKVK